MWNQFKTVILLGLLSGILLGIGGMFGINGLIIGFAISFIMVFISYFFSDKIALAMYKAIEVSPKDNPSLHKIVDEVCNASNCLKPKVYIINTPQSNAFATGRSPKKASIAVTTGIMETLTKEELKGVLAHEIAHVLNRDILISSIAAVIASTIGFIASMFRWGAIIGMGGDRDRGNILSLLILSIVTPIIAMLIQLAISRSREFLADKTGAENIGNSEYLATALEKIEGSVKRFPMRATGTTESTAHLFISNPFRGEGLISLLSTHPSTKERVKRLRDMKI